MIKKIALCAILGILPFLSSCRALDERYKVDVFRLIEVTDNRKYGLKDYYSQKEKDEIARERIALQERIKRAVEKYRKELYNEPAR